MKRLGTFALISSLLATGLSAAQPIMTTIAGGGPDGLPALEANIGSPAGIASDDYGNLYVAAISMHRILKIDPAGIVTVYAGNGVRAFTGAADSGGDGGPATEAGLAFPSGIAFDAAGDLFIADAGNYSVRRVDAATGIITTFVGTGFTVAGYGGDGRPAIQTWLGEPSDVAFDTAGNLYIADAGFDVVLRVDAVTGLVSTVAGSGRVDGHHDGDEPAATGLLNGPRMLLFDPPASLYVSDTGNHRVLHIDTATGEITTVAGDGVPRFAGDGGPAISASLCQPYGLALDAAGNLLIADGCNGRIRRVDATTAIITSVAAMSYPTGLYITAAGDLLISRAGWPFGAGPRWGNVVLRFDGVTGAITTIAGTGNERFSGDGHEATRAALAYPYGVAVEASGSVLIADTSNGRLRRVEPDTGLIDTVAGVGVHKLVLSASGDAYGVDSWHHRVYRIDLSSGASVVVAGNGTQGYSGDGGLATEASLSWPEGIALDQDDNVYIADTYNYRVRRVDAASGIITTVAGSGDGRQAGHRTNALGTGLMPTDVAFEPEGSLLIADMQHHRILRLDLGTGILETMAGSGRNRNSDGTPDPDGVEAQQTSMEPWKIAVDGDGNVFYVDSHANLVRRIDAITGVVTTVAGSGDFGFSGDGLPATQSALAGPAGLVVDGSGNLLIADIWQHRIRLVTGVAAPAP